MFKIDTHVHTAEVSICGNISAKELVREYKKAGYSGIIITDHFDQRKFFAQFEEKNWEEKINLFLEGYNLAKKEGDKVGLSVYLGMELRTPENNNEYLVYGVTPEFLLKYENLQLKPLSEVKKIVDENSLLIIQAHPYREMCIPAPKEFLHGVEVFNGHFWHNSHNDSAEKLHLQNGGIKTSGGDTHDYCDIGNAGVIFKEKPEDIVKAFKEGNYELIKTDEQGTVITFSDKKAGIKNLCKAHESDVAVIYDKGFKILSAGGKEIKDEVFEINRTFIVSGIENIKKAPLWEPIVLLVPEITDEVKDIADKYHAVLVVAPKSDDALPYTEGVVTYAGFDMAGCENFMADIMGPAVYLQK